MVHSDFIPSEKALIRFRMRARNTKGSDQGLLLSEDVRLAALTVQLEAVTIGQVLTRHLEAVAPKDTELEFSELTVKVTRLCPPGPPGPPPGRPPGRPPLEEPEDSTYR